MDSFSIVGSSSLESQGDKSWETDFKRMMKLDERRIGIYTRSSGIPEGCGRPCEGVCRIPDLFYCVSCESVYFCREDILTHCCKGGQKKCLGKRKKNTTIKLKEKDYNLVGFVSWLLPRVITGGERSTKYFGGVKHPGSHLFNRLCEKKLVGAPIDCYFGGFMLWVLTETLGRCIFCQHRFIHELFYPPRPKIDWESYSGFSYAKSIAQPTICIYDVSKEVGKDIDDTFKNCYDDDYDKVYYHQLKNSGRDDIEDELVWFSKCIGSDDLNRDVMKNDRAAEILSRSEISDSEGLFVLTCGHIFTSIDAGRFLKLFPIERTMKVLDVSQVEYVHDSYQNLEYIWHVYGHKENTKCLDPDDPSSYGHFNKNSIDKMFPIHNRFYHWGKYMFGVPVFELLSITIRELGPDRNFSSIYMESDSSIPLVIYKHPEGKEVETGKPLPLKGPFRLPNPTSNVLISFSPNRTREESWEYIHCGHFYLVQNESPDTNKVITKICMDVRNSSLATIKYRLSSSAIRAELAFTFFGELNRMITITDGYIVATDNEDVGTMRVVKEYYKESPVCLRSGQILPVDRYVFGVPRGYYLRVKVKLVYFVDTSPDTERMIEGYHDFGVPECVSTQGRTVPASGGTDRLCVECFWISAH